MAVPQDNLDQPSSAPMFLETNRVQPSTVHWLPCCIQHDGPAHVSQYFIPAPDPADPFIQQAAFRGHFLRGKRLPLPPNTKGLVVQPTSTGGWQATSEFTQLTYWNHERVPSHTDAAQRVIDWMSVAATMHQSVAPDAVQNAIRDDARTTAL